MMIKNFIALLIFLLLSSNAALALDITSSKKYAALVIDVKNNKVLHQANANQLRYPASLTKLMTLYLTFEALQKGKLSMREKLYVSQNAAAQPRSKLGLAAGDRISVQDAIYSLIVKSANDISVVLAEAIGGTEHQFVKTMNTKAKQLGMHNSNFVNPHGWHHQNQYTTADDMAKLSLHLMNDFPKYYPMFAKTSFTHRGKIIAGHNHVMKRYQGAEGMKTGYVTASGFNLVTTVNKPYGKLVAVVMGGPSAKARDDHMIQLLNTSFSKISGYRRHDLNYESKLEEAVINSEEAQDSIFAEIDKPEFNLASSTTKNPPKKYHKVSKVKSQKSKSIAKKTSKLKKSVKPTKKKAQTSKAKRKTTPKQIKN
jgi:D-alanyl-D-alanine carboxypeptidase